MFPYFFILYSLCPNIYIYMFQIMQMFLFSFVYGYKYFVTDFAIDYNA